MKFKLDFIMLLAVNFVYILSCFDRLTISQTHLSGLDHELQLTGMQYQNCLTFLFLLYVLLQVPENLMLVGCGRPQLYQVSLSQSLRPNRMAMLTAHVRPPTQRQYNARFLQLLMGIFLSVHQRCAELPLAPRRENPPGRFGIRLLLWRNLPAVLVVQC